ncbi:uncharacterized protein SEPMUDRAFT_121299 [Sphaerulina musiva SO2202]|uniref:Uncharacterized protein n=1 Tax=Sphaerulina musiva (strain SO2202) TaxID=692275 RepID=M3CWL5_SPHMS|nr:uncharacterized protein SEPMUDRAFT_121299 [Sphaerulina musiva SO2202]EMF08522.1 hypothetical protein SEPMUDRAFT_121299 [Sphaerulina musiva SO2202]
MSALKTSVDVEGSNAYVIAQCSAFKPHRAPTQHGWIAWHTETFSWPCEPRDFRPSKDKLLREEVLSRLSFHVLTRVRGVSGSVGILDNGRRACKGMAAGICPTPIPVGMSLL